MKNQNQNQNKNRLTLSKFELKRLEYQKTVLERSELRNKELKKILRSK